MTHNMKDAQRPARRPANITDRVVRAARHVLDSTDPASLATLTGGQLARYTASMELIDHLRAHPEDYTVPSSERSVLVSAWSRADAQCEFSALLVGNTQPVLIGL